MQRRFLVSHALPILGTAGAWLGGIGLLPTLGLALLVWGVASRWAERSVTGLLSRLRDDVERLGHGVPTPEDPAGSADVIGELATAISSAGHRLDGLLADLWHTNRELEERVGERTRELEERNRTLESVVDTIVHDLRAIGISMQGLVASILEGREWPLRRAGDRTLRRLLDMTEYQERLLRDLLTVVRIGKEPPVVSVVDVDALLREVVEECRAEDGEVSPTIRLSSLFPVVSTDPARLRVVFRHLIDNAIKFMGGQRDPMIDISAGERDGFVEFAVRDNGIGIAPAYHGKIFELFHRLQEIETVGTGAGLSIVKQIVERGGGRVGVDSEKGRGTTVSFTVPKAQASAIQQRSEVMG